MNKTRTRTILFHQFPVNKRGHVKCLPLAKKSQVKNVMTCKTLSGGSNQITRFNSARQKNCNKGHIFWGPDLATLIPVCE